MSKSAQGNDPKVGKTVDIVWRTALISLPYWELAFVILTSLIFGMFTWGFNPDDKTFRTTYILTILVGLPAGLLVGTILNKFIRSSQNRIRSILALLNSALFFIAYLWFYAKVPLPGVTIQYPSEFSGWHWADHYQMGLYYAINITLGLRLGLSFNSSPILQKSDLNLTLLCSGILMVVLFGFTWLSGDWTTLFLGMAILELGSALCWLPSEIMTDKGLDIIPEKSAHLPFFTKFLLPFIALGMGIQLGIVYIAKIGNFFWIEAYLEVFLFMFGIFVLNWGLSRKVSPIIQRQTNLLILIIGFLFLYLALILALITPNSIFWIVLTGISLGNFVWILADLVAPQCPAWKKFFHMLFLLILFTLGVGGGLAYYWYEASAGFSGKSIIPPILLVNIMMMGIFGWFYSKKSKTALST